MLYAIFRRVFARRLRQRDTDVARDSYFYGMAQAGRIMLTLLNAGGDYHGAPAPSVIAECLIERIEHMRQRDDWQRPDILWR